MDSDCSKLAIAMLFISNWNTLKYMNVDIFLQVYCYSSRQFVHVRTKIREQQIYRLGVIDKFVYSFKRHYPKPIPSAKYRLTSVKLMMKIQIFIKIDGNQIIYFYRYFKQVSFNLFLSFGVLTWKSSIPFNSTWYPFSSFTFTFQTQCQQRSFISGSIILYIGGKKFEV